MGLKAAGGNLEFRVAESLSEAMVKPIGLAGRRSIGKRRPVAFTAISVQGKLRNDEHFASDIEDGSIHFTLMVFENTQTLDLVGQRLRVLLGVIFADS